MTALLFPANGIPVGYFCILRAGKANIVSSQRINANSTASGDHLRFLTVLPLSKI